MKAIVSEGANLDLVLKDILKPIPKANEVVVRVKAASVNHRDLLIQSGRYVNLRYPIILGSDGAGVIEELGDNVENFTAGQKIIINPAINWGTDDAIAGPDFKILGLPDDGCFSEYVVVPASAIYPMPNHLSFEQSSAIPLSGLTAYRALIYRGQGKATEKLLITGIGGGVALFILQFALAIGMEVYVTSGSDEKIQKAINLGAKDGINYNQENWGEKLLEQSGNFDLIIDSAAGSNFDKLIHLAKPGGRIVIHGATKGELPALMPHPIFLKQLDIRGTTMGNQNDFSNMLSLINKHQIVPIIDEVMKLEDTNEALKQLRASQRFGKIIVKIE